MIQDIAEKNGSMNTDVVTGALERSTNRITGPAYMKAGMGDGGSCHPRDNIALRYLSQRFGLGYDLFDSIMKTREVQAKNLADKLVRQARQHKLPIIIMGKSYKPGVEFTEGSYSVLVGYYVNFTYKENVDFDKIEEPAVYLLGHRGIFNETIFPEGSIVVDPWRERKLNDTIYYGGKKQDIKSLL